LFTAHQRGAQRDLVDGLVAREQRAHGLEDDPVGRAVEVLGLEDLDHDVHRAVLEQDASQHGALGVE
jgi:hypothetical protein